jgi:hypothetical protein
MIPPEPAKQMGLALRLRSRRPALAVPLADPWG